METLLKNKTMSIDKIRFNLPGKITIILQDGRIIIVPLKYFPELKRLSVEKRKKYTIVDDRTILFANANSVYHLEDFIGIESKWSERWFVCYNKTKPPSPNPFPKMNSPQNQNPHLFPLLIKKIGYFW